ncbi:hypothetical protein L1987_87596 [Smallanthus sonchifolius]|nr:hypothetical protein L1987_87596 [Smallanthus sonchifolius]
MQGRSLRAQGCSICSSDLLVRGSRVKAVRSTVCSFGHIMEKEIADKFDTESIIDEFKNIKGRRAEL